jgi:hypothetical protein
MPAVARELLPNHASDTTDEGTREEREEEQEADDEGDGSNEKRAGVAVADGSSAAIDPGSTVAGLATGG